MRQKSVARLVRVVVERGIDDLGGTEGLTYASQWGDIGVGERVEVPLGRGDKPTGGVVIGVGGDELLGGLALSKIKPILERSGARLPETLVELAKWLAAYTISPLGLVLATMMPAAVKQGIGRRTQIRVTPVPKSPEQEAALTPQLRRTYEALVSIGPAEFPMIQGNLSSRLVAAVGPTAPRLLKHLMKHGFVASQESSVVLAHAPMVEMPHEASERRGIVPSLTPAQSVTAVGIAASLGSFAVHLLRGVTGSGKTEVYLKVIDEVLARGQSVIVLVPEISLTPQSETWFRARLGPRAAGIAVLHSGLSASQRHAEWDRVSRGEARVVIGPRSAVFAPVSRLGLIVVDEEHDHSYKHEQLPRYNARDVAVKRGQLESCPVLLASATPSLESWANATGMAPRYALWHLSERIAVGQGTGRMPKVHVVDLAVERRNLAAQGGDAWRRMIGPTLMQALRETLDAGGQAIMLLNRRGYAGHLCCASVACGWMMRCEQCDAGMVFHRDLALPKGGLVRCHHCLAEQLLPKNCPVCNKTVQLAGHGTQRLEEELAAQLGASHGLAEGSTMLRVDADTMTNGASYAAALSRFGDGSVRVLLGTQMISKGLDFPNVRLVGVVNADTALNIPDFRATERTFQLVSQVAGRAGRGEHAGRVIVQTSSPESPAIVHAASHDYIAFATEELEQRVRFRLPPATRMARIVCRELNEQEARVRATELARELRTHAGIRVEGPAPAAISRIAGYFRFSIELFADSAGALQRALTSLRSANLLKSDSRTAVDVDPQSLM
ncbi:MAG: primosomal protein N' [Planctomycetota bacterium]